MQLTYTARKDALKEAADLVSVTVKDDRLAIHQGSIYDIPSYKTWIKFY